jgi:hypothetical protein
MIHRCDPSKAYGTLGRKQKETYIFSHLHVPGESDSFV